MAGLFATLLALVGCERLGLDRLEPGQSTEADVRQVLGTPDHVREEVSGSRVLEFPRGPEGQRTYFVRLDAQGRFVSAEQVLRPDNFARVVPGMREDEVRDILGKPAAVATYAARPDETVWTWRWLQDEREAMVFMAYFGPDGRVRRAESTADPRAMAGA